MTINLSSSRRTFIASAGSLAATAGIAVAQNSDGQRLNASDGSVMTPIDSEKSRGNRIELAPPDKQPPNLKLPKAVDRKVGYAIVGLGLLSLEEILPAFAETQHSRCVALVSGHADKAAQVAKFYGVKPDAIYDYENYDRLSENREVEAVYIVLPNNMHAEFTIRAFKAGKHVLCEKPMATTIEECEQMVASADKAKRKLMIAYRLHYEPMNLQVMEWCREQKFGPVGTITSANCQNVTAPNIRLSNKLGGGPLGDIGIYSLNATRYITGEEPVRVTGFADAPADDPRFAEVPANVGFKLEFPSGAIASCTCSFKGPVKRDFQVHCRDATIQMDPAFAYRGLELWTDDGKERTRHLLPEVNHFAAEMDHFALAIKQNTEPLTTGKEGLLDLRAIAAINQSIRSKSAVELQHG